MSERVFFHIGLPKSGSTYLQTALWKHADALRDVGVLLPSSGVTDHRWGSLVVRDDRRLPHRPPAARSAWDRVVADVVDWPGTAVISHEFYGGASAEQAKRAVEALAPAEVHLVVTARDPLRTLTSAWQEIVKYGKTTELDRFSTEVSDDPSDIWNWRALDVGEVLGRWGSVVPADQVHVLPVPVGKDPELVWQRFAGLFLDDPTSLRPGARPANPSIGLVACEVMRMVGPHMKGFGALPRSTWVRKYLADTVLADLARSEGRSVERFLPGPKRIAECRDRGERTVRHVQEAGYDVIGDLDDLRVDAELPELRSPTDVTDGEVAQLASEALGTLLRDLRERTAEQRASERRLERLSRQLADNVVPERRTQDWRGMVSRAWPRREVGDKAE
ncbi:MAG: hypothetical protein HOQ45_17420 [Nocardioidaceae bacterium]|nr:hypothetical protein [Nocardioidaceae bacterium]